MVIFAVLLIKNKYNMKKVILKLKSLFKKRDGLDGLNLWLDMGKINCSNIHADVLTLPKCNTEEYLYAFKYNPDIYESCAATMSVHRTYKGAYKDLRRFLLDRHEQWLELPKKYRELYCIEHGEHYFISKIKLKD